MTIVQINLEDFQDALNSNLGEVELTVTSSSFANENPLSPPKYPDIHITVPLKMTNYALVPSENYKFPYDSVRCGRFFYVVRRGTKRFQSGEFVIISDVNKDNLNVQNAPTPTLYFTKTILSEVNSPLNVEFNVMEDISTVGVEHKFGISFQNTFQHVSLSLNPVITTASSSTVKITAPTSHYFITGDTITISGLSAVNGITEKALNGNKTVTILNSTQFTYDTGITALTTGSGGGSGGLCALSAPILETASLRMFTIK